jgi:hypothetical protein
MTPTADAIAGAPWLEPPQQELAGRILRSHRTGFGRPLLNGSDPEHQTQELFACPTVVLAHDGSNPGGDPGPRLTYANAAALALWERPWRELVGLPSRLTAEPQARGERARMLVQALERHAIGGYSGVRISRSGRRFQIRNARLWTLWDAEGQPCGQAAAFNDWWWL